MPRDKINAALNSARSALTNADKFTKKVEGSPVSRFAPPARLPRVTTTEPLSAPSSRASIREQNLEAAQDVAKNAGKRGLGTIGTLHSGGSVKTTGPYLLEKGEHVLSKEDAKDIGAKVKIKLKGSAAKHFIQTGQVPESPADLRSRAVKCNPYYNDDGGVAEVFKTPYDRTPMENTGPNPAASVAQQRAMAIAEHEPKKLYKRNVGLLQMKKTQLHDFAATPRKGPPKKREKNNGVRR